MKINSTKKILVYRWKAYNYDDVIAAFERAGCEVKCIAQKLLNYEVNDDFAAVFEKELASDNYEFVFSINYFPVISDICQKNGIEYVSYSCDSPLISMYHESVFNQVNRIFLFDALAVANFRAIGASHVRYLPLGVDTARLDRLFTFSSPFKEETERLLERSLTFVGSLYEKNSYDKISDKLPEYLRGYFDAAMQLESARFGTEHFFDEIMTPEISEELLECVDFEKSDRSFSDLPFVFSVTSLGFKCAQIQRKRALTDLSKKHSVCLFTESDTSDIFSVKNMGGVDYRLIMPWVFRKSAISLNFTISNIKTGIPLRVWDVLGARGFLFTNHQKELDIYFKDGEDLVWFDSEEELIEKADFYLDEKNASLRDKISQRGYEKVSTYHTFDNRISQLLVDKES
ncbi:MAG: hypothetical protein DUD27_00435 [Lachnospiraceae bacterium]|uniref:Glycosyltransferase n=1 Tax=Candidatus Weimeria bifida TaxID=2599074 RepID=A0A6N7J3T0_9FIRM|nr:glycosyltransferase [Candidatus Weimeria bifida]RRF97374.1 MAG: hypothetical protein DUD27_00435 [Lachnospiraceae bacterium]